MEFHSRCFIRLHSVAGVAESSDLLLEDEAHSTRCRGHTEEKGAKSQLRKTLNSSSEVVNQLRLLWLRSPYF